MAGTDERIYGSSGEVLLSIECKNKTNGVDGELLKAVLSRIQEDVNCTKVFVSFLKGKLFSKTDDDSFLQNLIAELSKDKKNGPTKNLHPAFEKKTVSIVVWKQTGAIYFLALWKNEVKAVGSVELLVVIIEAGVVKSGSWSRSGEAQSLGNGDLSNNKRSRTDYEESDYVSL